MNIIKRSLQILALLVLPIGVVFAADALAGNPIESLLTQSFPTVVYTSGTTYAASYSFMSRIPFTMVRPLTIEKNSSSPGEFSYDDSCTGKKLAYLEVCTVDIYLKPTTAGKKTVQLTEAYGHDRVPVRALSTTATASSGGTEVTGQVTTPLTTPLNQGESSPWMFTFTNNGTLAATGVNWVVSGGSYTTNCTSSLSAAQSCYVKGTYIATSTGSYTIAATLSYIQGAPVELSTTTTAKGGLACTPAVPFAPQTLINTDTSVTLLCTNMSGGQITITGRTPTTPTGWTTATGGDNCTPGPLPANAACQLKGTYHSPGTALAGVTVGLSVNYNTATENGLTSSTSTSTDVVLVITNVRNITLKNSCNFTVWWSMVGGAVATPASCTTQGECPIGSTCNISAKVCYYNNYGPTTGSYELAANGGTATTQIVQSRASEGTTLWDGLISASTQCNGSTSCLNNDCSRQGGLTSCTAGVGFGQPATEAEFAFLLTGQNNVDTYDISNVNGFSMPISMGTNQPAVNYSCGTAGSTSPSGNLNAAKYTAMAPPTNMYYWVTNSNIQCSAQNACSSQQICGLAFDTTSNGFVKNCGDFLGFWAATQICLADPRFSSPFGDAFSCSQTLTTPFPDNTYTLTSLLKCSPPSTTAPLFNSCYLSYPGASSAEVQQCCGCSDWAGIATPSASCPVGQTDSQWTKYVEKIIKWMKQACPTCYAYQYDDKASTFTCPASSATEYTITFCPGGQTGLPTGAAEGR